MPIHFSYRAPHRLLYSRFFGTVSLREILDYVEDTRTYDPLRQIELLDFRSATSVLKHGYGSPAVFGDMQRIVKAVRKATPREQLARQTAIVVTSQVHYGMARMYQTLGSEENQEIQVYRDFDKALRWLAVEDEGWGAEMPASASRDE